MRKGTDVEAHLSSLLFLNIPHGIFTVDEERRITSFNPAAEEITGWRAEQAIGRPCSEVFRSDHCQDACLLLRSVRTGERYRDHEVHIRRKDGTRATISVSTASLTHPHSPKAGGVEMFRDVTTVSWLQARATQCYLARDIVSRSPKMDRVRELVKLVANSCSTVLINGEPGTGKELVARAIHNLGGRCRGPFVAVNCGAIPDTLIESELFGHKQGAYTDAKGERAGRFAEAEGGTIFLDEIGELSPAAQVKLLRVLQEREYTPLGSDRPVKANIRVLAATNRDLEADIESGRFRQDLYFRIDVVRLDIPPLRDRLEDVPVLVDHFIHRFNALQGQHIAGISEQALDWLQRYEYPGNVRELENAIEYAFVVCRGDRIRTEHLPCHVARERSEAAPQVLSPQASSPLESAEAQAILDALDQCAQHRTRAAKALGISRNTLWRKMKRYGICAAKV